MNIFEEFVEELKQENLLEDTVIDTESESDDKSDDALLKDEKKVSESSDDKVEDGEEVKSKDDSEELSVDDDDLVLVESEPNSEKVDENSEEGNGFELDLDESDSEVIDGSVTEENKEKEEIADDDLVEKSDSEEGDSEESAVEEEADTKQKKDEPNNEKDAYKQRLTDRVSSLQMVDHILSGVQREQMRTRPEVFDSLPVKQALHKFFEAFSGLELSETTPEESELLKEIEVWHSALLEVDKKVSVANLRRYCESTKPPLSSQASLSLARFYRNSPYTEEVRCKFDLVATRLFTKDIKGNKREMVFERDELIEHIKELYADWASVPLYSEDEDDSEIVLAAFKFEDFIAEAAKVEKFDDLIKKGFFKRIKLFKKKTNENFFAPLLVTAAVESNVVIGNRYVDLIEDERLLSDSNDIVSKYGESDDHEFAEATSKSLQLAELLSEGGKISSAESRARDIGQSFFTSKVAYIALGVLAFAAVSIFIWNMFLSGSDQITKDLPGASAGKLISIDDVEFKEYITSPTVKGKTLYAVTTASWDTLVLHEREKTLKDIFDAGKTKGYTKVQLSDDEGSAIGFASKSGINVVE